jgi:hypothetical protein
MGCALLTVGCATVLGRHEGGAKALSSTSATLPLTVDLDLANPVLTRTVSPGTYQFRLRHRLPSARYNFEVLEERIPLPKLDSIPHSGGVLFDQAIGCEKAMADLSSTLDSTSEETSLDRQLESWIARNPGCESDGRKLFNKRTVLESGDVYTLHQQNQLNVKVARAGKADSAVWKFSLTTQPRGEWQNQYGFTFMPDRDEHYFSQANGDSSFTIAKKSNKKNGDLDLRAKFVPSVMFSWLPSGIERSWAIGPTAGVGYNFDDFSALLGFAAAYNENVTITGGVAMNQQTRLNGKYKKGQSIAENLEDAQLVEKSYRPNLYFGFALRLGKDPFAQEPTAATTAGAKPAAANDSTSGKESAAPAAGAQFDPNAVNANEKYGDWTVASVKADGAKVVATFTGAVAGLAGTLKEIPVNGQTQSCIKPNADQIKRIAAPKTVTVNVVCLGVSPAAVKDLKAGDAVKVGLKDLIVTYTKDNSSDAAYTATVTDAAKDAK